jgi:protoporphyrinogen oxidase
MSKKALIIGAGPAGLTAAYQMVNHTDIKPVIIEWTNQVGGISKTINYKGNRMDIGGHRFFSKSDTVMDWWSHILPVQNQQGPTPEKTDKVMLVRNRLSRIYYLRTFFDYPVSLSFHTLKSLGIRRTIKIGLSFIKICIAPIKDEKSLEDFFINRFGKELYETFFKDYTEKVWGVACKEISPEWGAQRIKGLSVWKTIVNAVASAFRSKKDIKQKNIETSLIESFLYPKYGPGQMWEEVCNIVIAKGGEIRFEQKADKLELVDNKIKNCSITDLKTGETYQLEADYFFSTMPVKELILGMGIQVPDNIKEISNGLMYRDFITVGLLLNKLKVKPKNNEKLIADNWIYIQEKDVKIGRLQIFNNWSPYMVADPSKVWIGLEYFCNEGDELWGKTDQGFIDFAIDELVKIDIIDKNEVVDFTLARMPKTYPAYFGTYQRFSEIREFTDQIENLFLIGRNGMHKYNNQDHSMLTAIAAVNNIINGRKDKVNIWAVNTEQEYHEEAK